MDWLLTVPLLLIEILLVMKLSDEKFSSMARTLGLGSSLTIVSGYYCEFVVTDDLSPEVYHEPSQQVLQSDLEKVHLPRSVQRLPQWIRRRSTLWFKLPKMPSPL